MKQQLIKNLHMYLITGFVLILSSCTPNRDTGSPNTNNTTLAQIVTGTYSGSGKYMPHLQTIGTKTLTCIVPDWVGTLKSGTAATIVSIINDSTVNVVLTGSIYSNSFNSNFILVKNGNEVSDRRGNIKYYIDTKSLQFAFSNTIIQVGGGCTAVNKYYYVSEGPITVPATPRYSYASIGNWEFIGKK